MEWLFLIGWIVGGFFVAQIAQRVVVPILVQALGPRRFAAPDAFDGCTLGIVGAFAAPFLAMLLTAKRSPIHGSPFWSFALLASGITLYGLAWLWVLGCGGQKREWEIEDNRIVHRDGSSLRPTSVRERSHYYQTDAFNGYSHYFLDLHDEDKLLATNAYTSDVAVAADLEQVKAAGGLRSLDLIWLHRLEAKVWRYARFPDAWTPILCGSLARLSDDDAAWWHAWMMPEFSFHVAREVEVADAIARVQRLRAAYPELQTPPDDLDIGRCWADFNFDLDALLRVVGTIIAVDDKRFHEMAHQAVGNRAQMLHDLDGLAKLS